MHTNDLSDEEREKGDDQWSYWNKLHKAANYSPRFEVTFYNDKFLFSISNNFYYFRLL